jgi:hypothetical protein
MVWLKRTWSVALVAVAEDDAENQAHAPSSRNSDVQEFPAHVGIEYTCGQSCAYIHVNTTDIQNSKHTGT